jgi:hypothetical protein
VPEDAEREPTRRVFDRLDRAVVGPRRLAKAAGEPTERLMVV